VAVAERTPSQRVQSPDPGQESKVDDVFVRARTWTHKRIAKCETDGHGMFDLPYVGEEVQLAVWGYDGDKASIVGEATAKAGTFARIVASRARFALSATLTNAGGADSVSWLLEWEDSGGPFASTERVQIGPSGFVCLQYPSSMSDKIRASTWIRRATLFVGEYEPVVWEALRLGATGVHVGEITLRRGQPLVGHVRSGDGQPISGARVEWFPPLLEGVALPWGEFLISRRAWTGTDGAFSFDGLGRARGEIVVRALGYSSVRVPVQGSSERASIVLERCALLTIQVTDDRGWPAAGVIVQAVPLARIARAERVHRTVVAGADGVAKLGLAEGIWELRFSPGGRMSARDLERISGPCQVDVQGAESKRVEVSVRLSPYQDASNR